MKLKFLFYLIICLLFCHAATGQLMIGKVLQDKMKEAEKAFNKGNYDFSKNSLEEILKEKENFAPAIRLLGLIHLRTGNPRSSAHKLANSDSKPQGSNKPCRSNRIDLLPYWNGPLRTSSSPANGR